MVSDDNLPPKGLDSSKGYRYRITLKIYKDAVKDTTMRFETTVTTIIKRTHDVKSFRFPKPSSFTYKAGQFMVITLRGEKGEIRKHFTISSSPTEDFIELTKKLTESEFTKTLDGLKMGDWARIDGPHGRFTFEGEFKKIGMLSGGIGITPLRSMCRYCADMQLDTDIVVLYGNRSEKDIVFKKELEALQKENENFKAILCVGEATSEWTGYTGRIDALMVEKEIPDYRERVFYVCGPPAMVKAMDGLLEELGVPSDQVRKENFTGYE